MHSKILNINKQNRKKMKGRFQNLQQFAKYITEKEKTIAPGDEMNITQANAAAKQIIKSIGIMGHKQTILSLEDTLYGNYFSVGKAELSHGQLVRLIEILKEMFNWEYKLFFPWSKSFRNFRNIKSLCKMYGYYDEFYNA